MITGAQADELAQAYDLLDIPHSSTPDAIKKAYRKLIKRWHPDRYRSGTPAYDEATQMTKQINEAYSQISSAPLRFGDARTPADQYQAHPGPCSPLDPSEEFRDLSPSLGRRIDFWTRLITRVLLTALVMFGMFFHASFLLPTNPTWRFVAFLAINLACGLVMAKLIQRFQEALKKHAVLTVVILFCTLFSGLTVCAYINPELVLTFIFLFIGLGFGTASAALVLGVWGTVKEFW